MKKKQKAAWFLSGILVTVIAVSVVSPALAALTNKTIQVSTGVSLYINDQKLDPKDPNGNPVEPFILDGTTYLPVRAVSEALGVPIQWEGSTWSVYIGQHTSDKPAVWLSQMDYFSGTGSRNFYTAKTEKDNLGNTHIHCITYSFNRTYILNGQYSRITGTLYQTYDERYSSIYGGNYNGGVYIYGDGELLFSYAPEKNETGIKPVPFNIDLTGVLELRVYFGSENNNMLSLGDVGLYT